MQCACVHIFRHEQLLRPGVWARLAWISQEPQLHSKSYPRTLSPTVNIMHRPPDKRTKAQHGFDCKSCNKTNWNAGSFKLGAARNPCNPRAVWKNRKNTRQRMKSIEQARSAWAEQVKIANIGAFKFRSTQMRSHTPETSCYATRQMRMQSCKSEGGNGGRNLFSFFWIVELRGKGLGGVQV